jgi:hypothetical protein
MWLKSDQASVPSLKFVVYIGELSAALAWRVNDRISGIFRGGPTPSASLRAVEIYDELLGQDTPETIKVPSMTPFRPACSSAASEAPARRKMRTAQSFRLALVKFLRVLSFVIRHL